MCRKIDGISLLGKRHEEKNFKTKNSNIKGNFLNMKMKTTIANVIGKYFKTLKDTQCHAKYLNKTM